VCFITAARGRASFLAERMTLTPGRVVDGAGREIGHVAAVQLVTVGQRKGLGVGGGDPMYAVAVDVPARTVTAGSMDDLLARDVRLRALTWAAGPVTTDAVLAQCSAHGDAHGARFDIATSTLHWDEPQRRVAPGQAVVLYDGDEVLGGGTVAKPR
jgi:tRNA-specific 2-thiouridylase